MSTKNKSIILFMFSSVLFIGVSLTGCSSVGIRTPSGAPVDDVYSTFIKGDARLTCGTSCSGAWGSSRRTQKILHDSELWRDLAFNVAKVGYQSDQSYYYLGRAAEGLGYTTSARIYYKFALSRVHKCDGGWINNCDGFIFPKDINARLVIVDGIIKKEAAIEAEKDKIEKEKRDALEKYVRTSAELAAIEASEKIAKEAAKKTEKDMAKISTNSDTTENGKNSTQHQTKIKIKKQATKTMPSNVDKKDNTIKSEEENKKQNEDNKNEKEPAPAPAPAQKPTPIRVRSVLDL